MNTPKPPKGTELIRVGKNDKWFLFKKDTFTIAFEDILTEDGKQIKQSAIKLYLYAKAVEKAGKRVREFLVKAVGMGIPAEGELAPYVLNKKAPNCFDKEKAIAFILNHGGNPDEFYYAGTPAKELEIR
jgi:hypothetical protein